MNISIMIQAMGKTLGFTNGYFHARTVDGTADTVIVTLVNSDIPAEAYNRLRRNMASSGDIKADTVVYFDYLYTNGPKDRFYRATAAEIIRDGFKAMKADASPDERVKTDADIYYYNNIGLLKTSLLTVRQEEEVRKMVTISYYSNEFRAMAVSIRERFLQMGMTGEEINRWFLRVVHEVYHPKKKVS